MTPFESAITQTLDGIFKQLVQLNNILNSLNSNIVELIDKHD